jgi:hypothetical protein
VYAGLLELQQDKHKPFSLVAGAARGELSEEQAMRGCGRSFAAEWE